MGVHPCLINSSNPHCVTQVKTWFQNRRMKFKRQTEEAEMEMKSPKYPTYPSFMPYSSFYPGYMPMAYKSENLVHYPYTALRSPPTPSGSSDSNFSPMSLTSPTQFSSLHSPLTRPSAGQSPRTPSGNPPTASYFSNAAAAAAGVLTPLSPPSSTTSSSPSPSPYHHPPTATNNSHHHHQHHHHHHSYFTADCSTTPNTQGGAAVGGVSITTPSAALQQLHFTAMAATDWTRPLPYPPSQT